MRRSCSIRPVLAERARACVIAGLLAMTSFPPTAIAQVLSPQGDQHDVSDHMCPSTPLSVYFAEGDVAASDQARALIGKLQTTARACEPDLVLLVAIVDIDLEGEAAEARARDRLSLLSTELMSGGVDADRIVTGFRAGKSTRSPDSRINAVEILFRRNADTLHAPAELSPPAAPPAALIASL